MHSTSSPEAESDVDNLLLTTPPRQMSQRQNQTREVPERSNVLTRGRPEKASAQPVEAILRSETVVKGIDGWLGGTGSSFRGRHQAAQLKVPRMLKELEMESMFELPESNMLRMSRQLEAGSTSNTPSPVKRSSKRCADGSQTPLGVKRGRPMRTSVETSSITYDMKFHPMDKTTRPNAAATRRMLEQEELDAQNVEDSDDDDEYDKQDEDQCTDKIEDEGVSRDDEAQAIRNSAKIRKAKSDIKFDLVHRQTRSNKAAARRVLAKELDVDEENDNTNGIGQTGGKTLKGAELLGSVRSTRGRHRQNLQAIEQSKYSPRSSTVIPKKPTKQNIMTKKAIIKKNTNPNRSNDENLLETLIGIDFDNMSPMDKILHNIQYGAPIESTSLPYSWAAVARALIREGFFNESQFKWWGGVAALKRRYHGLRCVIQKDYVTLESKDEKEHQLYWAEGMDVLDITGSRTIYLNKAIPVYMQGIEEFTQNDLNQKKKDFETLDEAAMTLNGEASMTLNGEASMTSPTRDEPTVQDTHKISGLPFEAETLSQIQNELEIEIIDTLQHSEDFSMIREEQLDREAAKYTLLNVSTSTASINPKSSLSPVLRTMPPVVQNDLEARSIGTTLAFIRSIQPSCTPDLATSNERHTNSPNGRITIQTPRKKRQKIRPSKRPNSSISGFIIHEDPTGTPQTIQKQPETDAADRDMPKENFAEEEDDDGSADLADTDHGLDSLMVTHERNSWSPRAISPNQAREALDNLPRPTSNFDPSLPSPNLSRTETSGQGIQSNGTPRTSSTLTS